MGISSGITKIMLMPQEVQFFNAQGIANPIIITMGVFQIIGAVLLMPPSMRTVGAFMLGLTFVVSLWALIMAGSWGVAFATLVILGLLGFVVRQNPRPVEE